MASRSIKGITIEIGGNTTKLESALKNVDKQVYSLNGDLKSLNQALKLDPKNTELLAQKQDVLKRNIQATTERLNTLKEAQRQMGDYNKLTDEQKTSYNRLSQEITKSETALKDMNKELKESSKVDLSKLKDGLKKVGQVAAEVTKKMLQVSAAVGGALAGLVTAGVKSYAELEQNIGGVETLFGKSANKVIENAKKAYKTAGVSANEYMAGVTSFSASLLQSLGGNTEKAAKIADMAFRDMSDNANKFGTDMASIQNAYQGFAKQNYTMLDNLKLGYGGTKTEMERLLKDAQKLTGVKYDIKNLSDVYTAINVIQKRLKVTGTTSEEAEKTISGSVSSMKAAFNNFLNGSGSPEDLSKTIINVFKNINSAVTKLAPSILKGVTNLLITLVPQIIKVLASSFPQIIDSITEMIDTMWDVVAEQDDSIKKIVSRLINKLVIFVTENLPKIIDTGLMLVASLAKGIVESLPKLIPAVLSCIKTIVDTLLENLESLLEVALQIIITLIDGLIDALPKLIDYLPTIIETIVRVLIANLPKLTEASIKIIIALINGLIANLPKLITMGPKIIISIVKGIIEALPKVLEQGGKIITTLIKGITNTIGKVKETAEKVVNKIKDVFTKLPEKALNWGKDMIKGLAKGMMSAVSVVKDAAGWVASKITGFLHFSRPDEGPLREYEQWMPDFIEGLAKGIKKSSYLMENATDDLASDISDKLSIKSLIGNTNNAMSQLSRGIETSINPIINPQANTNPFILQIENFNNNRNTDIQSLMQEVEFYRRQSAQSRGGN